MVSLTIVLVVQSSVGFEIVKWKIMEIKTPNIYNIVLIDYFRVLL